jgi:hypothetical protein
LFIYGCPDPNAYVLSTAISSADVLQRRRSAFHATPVRAAGCRLPAGWENSSKPQGLDGMQLATQCPCRRKQKKDYPTATDHATDNSALAAGAAYAEPNAGPSWQRQDTAAGGFLRKRQRVPACI